MWAVLGRDLDPLLVIVGALSTEGGPDEGRSQQEESLKIRPGSAPQLSSLAEHRGNKHHMARRNQIMRFNAEWAGVVRQMLPDVGRSSERDLSTCSQHVVDMCRRFDIAGLALKGNSLIGGPT